MIITKLDLPAPQVFEPIHIKITIETQEELDAFKNLTGMDNSGPECLVPERILPEQHEQTIKRFFAYFYDLIT